MLYNIALYQDVKYIFCGEHLLGARLQTADIDAAAGIVEERKVRCNSYIV